MKTTTAVPIGRLSGIAIERRSFLPLIQVHFDRTTFEKHGAALSDTLRQAQMLRDQGRVDHIGVASGPLDVLQFSLRSPLVNSTVVGMSAPERVPHTLELASTPIPERLWAELESQLPPSEQWLDLPSS